MPFSAPVMSWVAAAFRSVGVASGERWRTFSSDLFLPGDGFFIVASFWVGEWMDGRPSLRARRGETLTAADLWIDTVNRYTNGTRCHTRRQAPWPPPVAASCRP